MDTTDFFLPVNSILDKSGRWQDDKERLYGMEPWKKEKKKKHGNLLYVAQNSAGGARNSF